MRLYTTLWNINEMCINNDNNKHFGKIEKKNISDQHCSEWSVWQETVWL